MQEFIDTLAEFTDTRVIQKTERWLEVETREMGYIFPVEITLNDDGSVTDKVWDGGRGMEPIVLQYEDFNAWKNAQEVF